MDMSFPPAIQAIFTFTHPVLMWGMLGIGLYALKLGWQARRIRSTRGEERKKLARAKPGQKHFKIGSLYLMLVVIGTVGGMAVTYVNNGKLFVGPHLIAGLGMMTVVTFSVCLIPFMQQGKQWARDIHVASNVLMVGILGWQAVTGMQIVQRILE
ncbi:MAG: DUF4079 domain-containing protein [Cyanobacteria bacterium J06642_2]